MLGGPAQPLHWAITAGMVGFGVLLWTRRRLRGTEAPLQRVAPGAARHAGRAVFIVCGVVGALVAVIIGARLRVGEPIAALSVALPALGLAWLTTLGFQAWRYDPPPEHSAATERPSPRPVSWNSNTARKPSPSKPPDRHVSA
jgi:hypothetical protein